MVVRLFEIDRARDLRVHGRAAQLFGRILLSDCRLHQRGSGEEESAALGHQYSVGHHRQIRAARDAHAHDRGDLRNAHRRHDRIVAKDAAKIVLVGKDIFL